jgi:hypothetical protein
MTRFTHRWLIAGAASTFLGVAVGASTVGGAAPQIGSSEPGVATDANDLFVALPLVNQGTSPLSDVRILYASLRVHDLLTPMLPLVVGDVPAGEKVVLQLAFRPRRPARREEFELTLYGTHRVQGRFWSHWKLFRVVQRVSLPQPDEGERIAAEAVVEARTVDGADFPPTLMEPPAAEEPEGLPLPTGGVVAASRPDNPGVGVVARARPGLPGVAAADDVVFVRGTDEFLTGNDTKGGFPWDPSGASVDLQKGERVVFLTGNLYALLSTDGGGTFTHLDPTTIFGNLPPDGLPEDQGLCCDMNLIYVPSIDRFVWVMLTKGSKVGGSDEKPINAFNRLRVASASPAQVLSSGGTSWTYWDMTTALFRGGKTAFLDYPDVSFTDSYLHISVVRPDIGGFFVIRVPLADVQFGGTVHIEYTNPSDGKVAAGARLAHDSPDAAYWFGHVMTWKVRAFEWLDGSPSYSWRTLKVKPWPDADYTSLVPFGTNWIQADSSAIRGATFRGEVKLGGGVARSLLVAWNGARGGGFPQPHVRLLPVVKVEVGGFVQWAAGSESQIWNPAFAFHHAHLATNSNGEVGVSVGVGGGKSGDATPVAGFVGDPSLFAIGVSNWSLPAYGDYTAIRPHSPNTKLFSVSDYFIKRAVLPNIQVHHQYRLFGRSGDVGNTH